MPDPSTGIPAPPEEATPSIVERAKDLGYAIAKACPPAVWLLMPLMRAADRLQGGTLHQHVEDNIQIFCTPEQRSDAAYMRWLRRDMWYCAIRYLCGFNEYFLFGFPKLSHRGRRDFITEYQKEAAYRQVGTPETWDTLKNKWKAYCRFKDYYRREAILADEHLSFDAFDAFIARHPRFIVKPLDDGCGRGIFVCDVRTDGRTHRELKDWLCGQNVILEELIAQCADMARFHPGSVNTIRCATFLKDGKVDILFSFFRIGRGSGVVDNGGAGGFLSLVDVDTGILSTPGVTEQLETALIHPDTGMQIIGWQVPHWEEAKALARKMSLSFPEQPYISWDLALTDDGWVVVEANHAGQFVGPQVTTQCGYRPQMSHYFRL